MVHLGVTGGKTPDKTAARIIQVHCSDTHKTYRGGPDLFRKIDGRGWGLRDTHENTYANAGVQPPSIGRNEETVPMATLEKALAAKRAELKANEEEAARALIAAMNAEPMWDAERIAEVVASTGSLKWTISKTSVWIYR
jgi:hypothetical protein